MPSRHSAAVPRYSARAAALAVLLACQSADRALDDEMEKSAADFMLDSRDRALAMELAYGVLRRLEAIDWRLAPLLKKPLPRLPTMVQTLLRLGAYQILFMDRIPVSAAVDESVRFAKACTMKLHRDWSGFVNAVLRNLIRVPEPALPDSTADPGLALSVRYSIPLWLCQRWIERVGCEQAESACQAASRIPALTLRVNRLRLTREALLDRFQREGISARPATISPVGIILEKRQLVTALPGFQEGDFYVEDEAAQLIPPLLDPRPGDFVLDACAAPGGKATHLAELMKNQGHILALDRQKTRLALLRENCRRLGITIVTGLVADARNPLDELNRLGKEIRQTCGSATPSVGWVDRVLLDAPCSGLGVLRRHPEAKWRKDGSTFARHRQLQLQILESLAPRLRPGGVLVYSTCSTEPEETTSVIEQFLCAHAGFRRESIAPWLPSTAHDFLTEQGDFSTMGNRNSMDGFYATRLRKQD